MIEVGAEPGLAVGQQEPITFIGGSGSPKTGNLASGPQPTPVHIRVGAAGKGELTRLAKVGGGVETRCRQAIGGVQRTNRQAGEGVGVRLICARGHGGFNYWLMLSIIWRVSCAVNIGRSN